MITDQQCTSLTNPYLYVPDPSARIRAARFPPSGCVCRRRREGLGRESAPFIDDSSAWTARSCSWTRANLSQQRRLYSRCLGRPCGWMYIGTLRFTDQCSNRPEPRLVSIVLDHHTKYLGRFRSNITPMWKGQALGLSGLRLILGSTKVTTKYFTYNNTLDVSTIFQTSATYHGSDSSTDAIAARRPRLGPVALCAAFSVPLKSSTSYKEIIVAWSISVRRNRSCNGLFTDKVMAAGGTLEQSMWLFICSQPCYPVSSGLHVSLMLRGFLNRVPVDWILDFPSFL